MLSSQQIIIRLLLSVILSGCIGMEREKIKRPAGIRTHMLVCVGATLVMLTSSHLFKKYPNIQIDRLGAQVISGIGFLGAGTIIRQGNDVQGLTTAAGLWAVACIGLSIGSGFYLGGIAATIIVLATLVVFKKVEEYMMKRNRFLNISIVTINRPGQIGSISESIEEMGVSINRIEFNESKYGNITLNIVLKLPEYKMKNYVISRIISQDGVIKVTKKTGRRF